MKDPEVSRRKLLLGGALAGAAGAAAAVPVHDGMLGASPEVYRGTMPWRGGAADAPPGAEGGQGYRFFTAPEAAFIEAAVDRLIPADPTGPSATEAGVPFFIDRQLTGPYGRGDHFFLAGPWSKGTPEQGYQSRFPPSGYYRASISAIGSYLQNKGRAAFAKLSPADQDGFLSDLQAGRVALDGADAKGFFTLLLQNTKEGYFSDPIYGGNRGMAAWKMIGFPGARYDYREWVGRHGQAFPNPPVSFLGRPGWTLRSET